MLKISISLIYLIISFYFVVGYDIPNVNFNKLDQGFTLNLPDEPGLRKVIFSIFINEKCPPLMDILFEPKWMTKQIDYKWKTKDSLSVSLLIDHNGTLYNSQQYLKELKDKTLTIRPNHIRKSACRGAIEPNLIGTTNDEEIPKNVECKKSETFVNGLRTTKCQNELIFEENFDSKELSLRQWSYDVRHRLIGRDSDEFVVFDKEKENIYLMDGLLNIKPIFTKENIRQGTLNLTMRCTPYLVGDNECFLVAQPPFRSLPPVTSAQIHTMHTFRFKYGRVELRVKLPKGDWIIPYIMLQSQSQHIQRQLRIGFARGNEQLLLSNDTDIGGRILYGGHVSDVEKHISLFTANNATEHWGNAFHTYTMIWTKDLLTFEVDNERYGEIRENLANFNDQFFLTLGVSVGGHLEFPDMLKNSAQKPWINTSPKATHDFWNSFRNEKNTWNGEESMMVDYVRVYAV